jgi:hypothetical protein
VALSQLLKFKIQGSSVKIKGSEIQGVTKGVTETSTHGSATIAQQGDTYVTRNENETREC